MLRFSLLFLPFLIFVSCHPSTAPVPDASIRIHPIRLHPGEDLRAEIEAYVAAHDIEAGYIITCVGSLTEYHLRYANQEGGAGQRGHFEIVSLVGTVSVHGSHLHLSVADSTGRTTGGHLLPGNLVYTTAEIVIGESTDHVFERAQDTQTRYRELDIRAKE